MKLEAMWKLRQAKESIRKGAVLQSTEMDDKVFADLKGILFRLRRLRLQIERAHKSKAEERLFKEHTHVNIDFETVEFEKLEQYFELNELERIRENLDTSSEFWVKKIVTR